MAKGRKYYVVWKGRIPGIYNNWEESKNQVDGFENALYKSFATFDEAREAFGSPAHIYMTSQQVKIQQNQFSDNSQPIFAAIAVDAACSGAPGNMEYQGVFVRNKKLLFHKGPFKQGTNNVGEFLALVHALALCKNKNLEYPIYSDSITAIAWVRAKKAKTKLFKTKENEFLFELIERAEYWLANNTFNNKILKWDTVNWGEIPADFGRK